MPLRILTPIRKARLRGGRGKPTQPRLEALNDKFSAIVSMDLQKGLNTFARRINYDTMANAVYSGDWKKVYGTIPTKFLPSDIEASMQRLGVSIEDASRVTISNIPFGRGTDPDALLVSSNNPKLDKYLDVRSGALITNIQDNMQVNVQAAVRAGIDNKETAEQVAERIRSTGIGLNERQNIAMQNFEAARRAEGINGIALADRLDEQAARYLNQRCDMIARTEVSFGQNFAQLEVWNQAQEDGILSDTATKIWVVDGNPCPVCRALSGQEVGIKEMFTTIDGEEIASPPQHPNCLCALDAGKQ